MEKEKTAKEILREVRKILRTPEMEDIEEHAWRIMQEVELYRGDPNIQKIKL